MCNVPNIRIAIIDSRTMFREGLKQILEAKPGFQVVAESTADGNAKQLLSVLQPDILLFGLSCGLQTLSEMASASPVTRLILFAPDADRKQLITALRLGARAILARESGSAILLRCIAAVLRGEYWISRNAVSEIVEEWRESSAWVEQTDKANASGLSKRERQVLRRISFGCSNKEIALDLSLTEQAVKYHLTNMYRRFGLSDRLQLARFSMDHQLIDEQIS